MAASTFAQFVSVGNLIAAIGIYLVVGFVFNAVRKPRYPSSLPWVGKDNSFVAGPKAVFASLSHIRSWAQEGYEKYSKKGQTFILPTTLGAIPEIIIPRSQTQWLLEQPDNVLSTSAAHYDSLHGDHNFLDSRILSNPYHEHVVHRSLPRHLNNLIPAVTDEVKNAMDHVFGCDETQWVSVNLQDALLGIVPRLTSRMMVGLPLCRTEEYLDNMANFTNDVVRQIIVFRFIPTALRPVVGATLALANHYHYRKTAKYTIPLVKQRLADMARKDADPTYDWKEPTDYISWHIRLAQAEKNAFELDPKIITYRLMPINFAAIHTTVMTTQQVLFDLFASDPSRGFVDGIREEVERVLRESGGVWTKDALARLYRADSAIRESMRVSNWALCLVHRKVVAPEGVTNTAEGWHAPYGAKLGLNLESTHHDPDIYPDPYDYDAFRFSRPREEYEARPREEKGIEEGLQLKKMGLVTMGDAHFPFGHGRHACPGRFFVAHELKIVLAYLVLNYDIKHMPERPRAQWIGSDMIPPSKPCIRVRRRSGTVSS